ncbi:hypothetical protein FSP39_013728 [Pinctada imbricata]|uniref:Uncharacterized protein n=1 Tax=Pinctada imbricata TaxID=66713 RepID=A0AA89C9Z3_PINIB|nr:hypothetical protein FSP39_013728 [Pinctada imbricata]
MTETELFTDIDTKCDIQLDMYRKRRESCESIQKQLTDSSELLSTLTDKSKPEFAVSTLIDMQKSRESELSSIQNMKVNFQRYKLTFTEDAGIDNFLRKCSQFGHVNESFTVLSQADFLTSEDVARERRQTSASQFNMLQLQTMIDAKLRGEQRNWITSVCFMADNRVVLIDRYNEKVKMFSEDCEFLDSYFFENTRLFAVASTNVDEIAVTLPVKMKIKIISTVGNKFKVENVIDTKQPCFGIAITFNHLFVCCATVKHMPCCIKIFDAEYQFVRDITFDNEGVAMFTSLSKAFIAVAPEQNNVSVVDKRSDRHTIVTFDMNGKVKSRDPMPL